MRSRILLLAVIGALSSYSQAATLDPAATRASVDAELSKDYAGLDLLYQDIHSHPELGFHEEHTAALLASRMRALGFEVTGKVGGTGVVALYRNGPGPVVLVRTELDALPMEEKTGLPYASRAQTSYNGRSTFVAHSCGHDVHMAWWIGTAQALVALKARWSGTLMFVAQPAEELVAGAPAMINDGLFTRFPKPNYGFAAHVTPAEAGTVTIKEGVVTSNVDGVDIMFKGRGGHGSMPSATIDPIVIGAHFVTDVQTVISRQKDAGAFGVVTVGMFQGGTVGNIIPDQAEVQLSLRSYAPDVRQLLLDGVTRTAAAAAAMAMAPSPDVRHLVGAAAVVNDNTLATRTATALTAAGGDRIELKSEETAASSGSEDYSAFVEAGIPSVYMMIGGYDAATLAAYRKRGEPVPTNHSPFFAPNHEIAIHTGVRSLALAVMAVMPRTN